MNAPVSSKRKQRSKSPSQAMPRSAPCGQHRLGRGLPVLRQQRVGDAVGEAAVRLVVDLDELERQVRLEQVDAPARRRRCRR